MWHYTGELQEQTDLPVGEELWEAAWQSVPEGTFSPPALGTSNSASAQGGRHPSTVDPGFIYDYILHLSFNFMLYVHIQVLGMQINTNIQC